MDSQRVQIERLVAGGDALGRLGDGRVVFVPGALPAEVVDVEITHTKKDFARGRLINIVTPSPSRIAPESASCNVAIVRISVDLPAPLGPRRPYMPVGMVSETSSRASTPLA